MGWLLFEVVEITNWGARLPQNRFGWRWLLFEELWTPSLVQRFRGREHGNTNIFLLLSSLYYFTLTLQHGTGQPAHCAILYWRCRTVCVNQPIVLFYIDVVAWYALTSPLCYFTLTLRHGTRQSCIYIGLICVSWYPIFMSLIANSQGFSLNYGRVKKSSFYLTTVWVAMKHSFIKRLYLHYIQITLNT